MSSPVSGTLMATSAAAIDLTELARIMVPTAPLEHAEHACN